ncbi:uncharacterized protein LOC105426513 [Pogonomyrmex barbatus]|uniref:Uncharacterized protein LOC105426513 n=1 Tax=Pogonomyrmex barbatus TaxID=144034 RepID=A0A6I9W419_9HYME|nr:uncharacterized protein LOC105426513 [Pogonomyrmex barbatus]
MSRTASHRDWPLRPSYIVLLSFILILTLSTMLRRTDANPLPDLSQEYQNLISGYSTDSSLDISINNMTDISTENSTEISPNTDVYVIKAVVYEIGILTDMDNSTNSGSTERQERVDISLYDTPQEDEFS